MSDTVMTTTCAHASERVRPTSLREEAADPLWMTAFDELRVIASAVQVEQRCEELATARGVATSPVVSAELDELEALWRTCESVAAGDPVVARELPVLRAFYTESNLRRLRIEVDRPCIARAHRAAIAAGGAGNNAAFTTLLNRAIDAATATLLRR